MTFFNRIRSNVKGDFEYPLGRYTAVVGQVRSGKTAVTDAVRLALTGKHPAGQYASDLMDLAPRSAESLYSVLEGDLGIGDFLVQKDSNGKAKSSYELAGILKDLSPEDRVRLLPTVSYRDLVTLGDAKSREAMFSRFGGLDPAKPIPTPTALGPDGSELWSKALRETMAKGSTDPATVLSGVSAWMRKEKLAQGKVVTALKNRIEELRVEIANLGPAVELVNELEAKYQKAQAYENSSSARDQYDKAQSDLQKLYDEKLRFVALETQLHDEFTDFAKHEAKVNAETKTLDDQALALEEGSREKAKRWRRVDTIVDILDDMVKVGLCACPICETNVSPEERRKALTELKQQRLIEYNQVVDQVKSLHEQSEALRQSAKVKAKELDTKRNNLSRDRAVLESRTQAALRQVESLKAAIGPAMTYDGPSAETLRTEINTARSGLTMRKQLEDSELELRAQKIKVELIKELEDKAERLLQTLLFQMKECAEETVNKYLPVEYRAVLEVDDGVCQWSIIGQDGQPHRRNIMSGSEQASLVIALALAWTDGAPVRVVTLDDQEIGTFHSSPEILQSMLLRLKAAVDEGTINQVIVTGIRENEVPNNWTVIKRQSI